MQEENGNLPWAFNTDTLLSATQLDAITQLAFSDDGDFLISLSQRNWRDQVSYRIWDLSPKRRASLNEMTDNQLQHYACQIAQLEQLPKFQEALNGLRPCVSGDLRAPARANPESDGKAP